MYPDAVGFTSGEERFGDDGAPRASRATPLVSVVVPTFRRPDRVVTALWSVFEQTWRNIEVVVVDDNGRGTKSQRATEAAVHALMPERHVVYVVHERNRGACAARNSGVVRASGSLVAFLDDDDVWYLHKLERQVERLQGSPPHTALVYAGFRKIWDDGRSITVLPDGLAHQWPHVLRGNSIGTTSLILVRREALMEVGGFDESLPAMQDFDLYVRLALLYPMTYVDEVLMDHSKHDDGKISTDHRSNVRAHAHFYAKHRLLIERDRVAKHQRLSEYAREAARAGDFGHARQLFLRAWVALPHKLSALARALIVSRITVSLYRRLHGLYRAVSWHRRQAEPRGRAS